MISCNHLLLKAYQKWFFVCFVLFILPKSPKILIIVFAFLCVPVEVNSKEISLVSFFFQKNADVSIFAEIQG